MYYQLTKTTNINLITKIKRLLKNQRPKHPAFHLKQGPHQTAEKPAENHGNVFLTLSPQGVKQIKRQYYSNIEEITSINPEKI
jgi:hypothetical protein